ncbi:amidohydrolase family protein [Cohnella sp. 56]|uniref:amidohydrolase family protein n=1 Tax=Cohnella sp. 56 TaxID=3113722 RepID=UPI0030E803DD
MMKIDAHQHFYDFGRVPYSWPTPNEPALYRYLGPEELEPLLADAGIEKTVVVQADHSLLETDYLLEAAAERPWIAGIVGWVPLDRPDEAAKQLERLVGNPYFKGVRHLIHDESDPDWVVRDTVVEGLKALAAYGVPFDVVAVLPRHLEHVVTIAERVPELRMVIDHLGKPPIKSGGREPWAGLLARAAECPQVYGKVSGLNTAADPDGWSWRDLKPYIDHAVAHFGADRLMFGSDWPVANLAGDYRSVWQATNLALADYSEADRQAILGGTAMRFYGLKEEGAE